MKWQELKVGHSSLLDGLARQKPHELLRVSPTATKTEIKAAYIKLVKSYHPDRSDTFMADQNQEIMKLLNAAYKSMLEACNE